MYLREGQILTSGVSPDCIQPRRTFLSVVLIYLLHHEAHFDTHCIERRVPYPIFDPGLRAVFRRAANDHRTA